MEETTPTFIQEYFGEYGIMGSIIVILLFIIGFLYLRQKYPKMTLTKEAPEETPAEEPEPEPLLIHCPACGTEVSRYAPACLKCGHPICPTESTHNETVINVQPEKKEDRGCLWTLLGLIVLIVASVFFNFIGYFIALIILALCRVFSAGEAIFLFIVGLILTLLLPILGIISLGALNIMETWHIWIIIALLLFIIEIFTSGFAIFCISVGAIAAAIASELDMELKGQLICFSIATFASFVAVRPLMIKYFHKKSKQVQTNTNALIGRTAIVTETIDVGHNSGRVKIDGDVWRAIASKGEIIEIGEEAIVEQVNSTILTVKKL